MSESAPRPEVAPHVTKTMFTASDRVSLIIEALRDFEKLPVRRLTEYTTVMERAPLDEWRARCGDLLR